MYYDKMNNEVEEYFNDMSVILKDDERQNIILVLTNMRLIILIDIENNLEYNEYLEKARGRKIEEKYINMEFKIDEFSSVKVLKDRQIYLFKNGNALMVDDLLLLEKISKYLEITYV